MAHRVIILDDGPRGRRAVEALDRAAGLFRSLCHVEAVSPAVLDATALPRGTRLVAFDPAVAAQFVQSAVAVWPFDDDDRQAAQLVAELLGGGAGFVPRPPAAPPKPKSLGIVKLSRETAGRRGKGVTVVSELPMGEEALKDLATALKSKCGSGGTAKDRRIEIQGDHRDAVQKELERLGYKVKRSGG